MQKTNELVQKWIQARKAREQAEAKLSQAETQERIAKNELGNWLVPDDYKIGEPFHLWHGSGVICATKDSSANSEISWRREPDGKDRIEFGF